MVTTDNNIVDSPHQDEKLIDIWGRRTPRFEKRYEDSVLRVLSTYGIKAGENTEAKGKILGAGYEPIIIAFFIGLYENKRLPLSTNSEEIKDKGVGHYLKFWGNNNNKLRNAYPRLREYIFDALVARTDIDWIALDKGELKVGDVVTRLMNTMEEYVNYGLSVMEDKLEQDKGYFFSQRSFLDMFMEITKKEPIDPNKAMPTDNDDVESLD